MARPGRAVSMRARVLVCVVFTGPQPVQECDLAGQPAPLPPVGLFYYGGEQLSQQRAGQELESQLVALQVLCATGTRPPGGGRGGHVGAEGGRG
ncbi:hypothetical protein TREES_T100012799 [Tupaia chinensis]|uniref:Uncharacterized protein n=1 Tax=Tupaia chinensis TaxID=246437 RepID=L9LBZ9_TUPCH|nr:hypothetical protein TREES_T100012799 [Tupaia chinensis]